MRNLLNFVSKITLIFGICIICQASLFAQNYPQDVDLKISLDTELPPVIKINGVFAVQANVSLDANSSTIPSGETIRARIELLDPDGIAIDSYEQTWDKGFTANTDGRIQNDPLRVPGKVLFQIPWSQADKWTADTEWKILIQVFAPSVETDLSDNIIERKFPIVVPDLVPTIESISAVDPLSGELSTAYVPNTNYQVSGRVTNVGQVSTQPGVYIPVLAKLLNENGSILDEEIILLGGSNQFNYIESNGAAWEFTIDELFVPPTETGVLSLSLEVNPNTLPGGAAHIEQDYSNNSVSQNVDLNIDNQANENQRPKLIFVPNSYLGERGTFRGMDPAFISFAVRNSGRAPVGPNDYAKASIFLSKDLVVDKGDFVIREFNLSGDGIGLGLLAGDTINLTWNQQLPDNYEGDFYLLIQIENGFYENKNTTSEQLSVTTIETTQLDTTPVFTLLSENHGETRLLLTDPGQSGDSLNQLTAEARGIEQQKVSILTQKAQFPELGYAYDQQIIALNEQLNEVIAQINALASPAERPDVSKDGRFLVFEKKSPIGEGDNSSFPSQQIYLLDMMQPDLPPVLITRRYGTNANPEAANGNSLRPRISYNGDTVVFHSIANNLVPGDTNNKEDVFVYRISTQTMFRAVNSNNEQFNGRSLYPAVNGDGTKIVFESDSTNADLNYSGGGSQIYLWTLDQNASGSGYIRALTKGNGESFTPSIDDKGDRIVFHSYASNLVGVGEDTNNLSDIFLIQLDSQPSYNTADFYEIQPYIDGQGNSLFQATFLVNRSYRTEQSTGGHSLNAKISGNGERIIFESKATNLVTGSGIALVEVIEGGGGYQGNPKIEIFDTPGDFNGSGAPGTGAELALKSGGINELQEIDTDAIIVIDPGTGYVSPQVRIIPDPDYPEPTLTAKAVAYLGSPEGDVYYVNVADLNGSNTQPTDSLFSHRISQSVENSGGNFGSRDASIDWNGSTILYSTKSSNLLKSSIRRDDGVNFYNSSFVLPKARAVLVGGIGEIEISSYGIGYEPGTLFIEDLSGSGSGAVASYEVDNLGRIVTIHVIDPGENYNLDSTVVSVVEPRGGTGFEAGTIRFPQTIGEGVTRQGGGRIFSVAIEEHGKGYFIGDSDDVFSDIIQFEGDGADLNQDGFPDGRLNPERLKNLDGSLYLEQRFDVDVLSSGPDLANTTLTISDKNNSNDPLVITFGTSGISSNNHIIISTLSKSEIRDEIIRIIKNELDINSSITDIERNPIIDNNLTAGTSFVFRALSGSFISSNPSAIQVGLQSNMLIMGSGYSTVTPVVNQVPSIFGFSEVLSNPQFELDGDVGRMTLLSATDFQSDDVYKYDVATAQNERISTSSFGTPVKYLANPSDSVYPSPPSNRFPVISGNGRYAFFTSDTWGNEGLAFITSNQFPQDFNPARDIYLRDLKTTTIIEEDVVSSVDILYPTNNLSHAFSAGSSIPIISDVEYSGVVGRLAVFVNQEFIGNMEEFGGGLGGTYRSGRFSTLLSGLNAGEYSLQLVAYGIDEQVLATSSLIRFEVSPYDGSLPPVITMANPSGFSAITSTSVIPISANAEDPDGTISSVSYYVDGQLIKKINRFTGVSETDQSFAMLLDINQTLADGETQGFRTIFAIAEDSSGNFVSSQIHNLSFTKGSTPPAISITRGINGFRLTAPGDLNVTRDASTKGIKLGTTSVVLTSGPIGANLIDAKVIVAGTGTGAEIVPIIDLDPLSPDYGKLTDFNVTVEGSGYDADLELSIIPIVRAINEGVRAEVDYIRNQPDDANATTRVDEIRSSVNPDGSLKLGSGYVVAPRLVIEPIGSTIAGNERLQLEQTDAPITKLLPVDLSPILPADSPANRAEIIGGFAQAPIFISIEAIPSDELIESVSLVINGEVDPELVKTFPDLDNTYNFTWVPGDIGDYSVAAIVRDFAGNIVSTEESTISVQNFYGSGVNINLGGTFEYEVEGNGQLFLQVDATSEYDVLEVEFFIDSQSVGRQVSIGSSNFQHVVDLSDPAYNFRQGEHEITIIAYDTKGNTAGTFSRTLTNLQGRINPTLNILPPLVKNKPEVSLVYPLQEIILTKGSTIRLSADANDSNGDLHGVQFYQVGSPIHAWSGKLDFNNTVPTDGRTLTLYDGTSNAPITFEFDDDFSVFGGGAPAAVPSQSNELNDLSVEGNFTYFKPVDFFVEIHQLAKNGDGDRFRWSLDGGLTFVEEYVEISPGGATHSLAHGLGIKFTNDDGHAVGDRWTFTGRPLHQIVRIEDVGSTAVDVRLTRDNLEEAINEIASMGLLSVRSFTDSNYSNLYLTHTFDRLIEDDVDLSGTALSSAGGSILFTNNDLDGDGKADDFILSQASDPTRNQPFGMTWEANTTGSFILFAVAEDSDGNRQNSNSTIVTVISSVGELPHVELGPVEESMVYSGSAVTASLSAEADDPDGTIAEVSFYGNGVLIESDSTRPYSTSFEINATGHYEVYAVARDNSGNLVTSNVRRIVVNEITEEPEQPLVLSASTAYLGGVGEISATYKSPSGVYDSNIRALVYIDGSYAGDADLLPRTPPALGEEDPGQGFAYDLPARSPVAQEIEFIIINGAETSSATQTLSYEPSPLSDDLEFLNTLFTGMFNRMPESFELGEFYFPLRDGDLTREQIIEQLSSRNEFLKARNMLLAQKTIKGDWKIISDALEDFDPSVVGEIPGGSANIANRPDDSDNIELATPVGWNAVIQGTIDEPNDLDWFVIESRGPRQDGLLNMTLLTGHPGVDLRVKDTSPNEADIGLIRALGDQGEFLFGRVTINNYNDQGSKSRSVDLRDFPGTNYKYHFRVVGNQFHTGPYTIVLENDIVAAAENQQEILANLGQVASPVNDFNLRDSLSFLVRKFEYTDQYGAMGTHNPEEFFTRLFRNKYEQDPSPIQITRGVGLLTDSNFTQFQFLHDFALENKIITVGGYNYTTSESNGTIINIPNVPLDAGAFADTALVYSALIGEAPTRAEVAKITLTPDYQLRPMTERARMIMEMPAYAARYGLAMPEVDLPNLKNGRTYSAGKNVLVDAASLGADNLAGTIDDGHIREIKVLFNGKDLNTNVTADGFYYEFQIPSLPDGEYLVEVIAEDRNGLTSRAQRNIFLGTPTQTVALISPAMDEILDIDEEADFQFTLSDPTYSAYLEVNGRIPWIGNIQFSGEDLPDDESNVTIKDGVGGEVTFEFDSDFSTSSTQTDAVEEMYVEGTDSLSASTSNYLGTEYREYIIEIDGDGAGPNGNDTFRWSIDGGAHFNNSAIEINASTPSKLSAGIEVDFDSNTSYSLGDRWRIKAYPTNEIVAVGRYGSFADRLATTRQNLVDAINRVNNEGKLAIRAKKSEVESTSSGWFNSLDQNKYGIEIRRVGDFPIREKLSVDTLVSSAGNTTLNKADWLASPWKDSTSNASPTLSLDLRKMGFSQPMLEARVVAFDDQNNTVYSEPRSFTLRDPSRLSIELTDPIARKASIRLKSSASGTLTNADFEILDGGTGYTGDTAHLSIISEYGTELVTRLEVDPLGEVSGVVVLNGGKNYTSSDLVMVSSPLQYKVGESVSVSAKVRDPLSELDRVAFYVNGVELDVNSTSGSGTTYSASYEFTDESAQFVTARALFGDSRDYGPSTIAEDEWMSGPGIAGDRINYWGWRRHWAEQHFHGPGYVFPEWFIQDQEYWALPPPWLSLPYGPGSLPVQVTPEAEEDPISVSSSGTAHIGSVQLLDFTFRSEDREYDNDLNAYVYVDGQLAGMATKLAYDVPEYWEADPGYQFEFAVPVHTIGDKEVEIFVTNGADTFTAYTTIKVEESPFTDDYQFLKSLWNGLFDRDPEGAEIGAYLAGLRNESMTRPQVIEHIRTRQEFISSRDILLTHKTLHGVWEELPIVLENTDQEGYGSMSGGSGNSAAEQAAMGMPYTPTDRNESDLGFYEGVGDDHSNLIDNGTWIGMNDINIMSVLSYNLDRDVFKIKSDNLDNEGNLFIYINRAPLGQIIQSQIQDGGGIEYALGVQFLDGTYSTLPRVHGLIGTRGIVTETLYDLSGLKNVDFYTFSVLKVGEPPFGGVLLSTSNTSYLDQANFLTEEEIAQLYIESRVNDFNPTQAIAYQTNSFSYTNRYGQIETHDPASFFHRLFLNKYDQEPNPMQASRGVQLLKDGTRSQLDFLQQFATENNIITVGGYNYTTSSAELAIPNVPIDAAAFAETALVYSALMNKAPSKTEVAKLTLDPYFEVRPLAERARLILEMPEYAAQYGASVPKVDFWEIQNGDILEDDEVLVVEAYDFGIDGVSGTYDDGQVDTITILLNGKIVEQKDGSDTSSIYTFSLGQGYDSGEYLLEAIAQSRSGHSSRSHRQLFIKSNETDISITTPAHGSVLQKKGSVDVNYQSSKSLAGTSFLEINGKIRWSGMVQVNSELMQDNTTLSLYDGTGRSAVIFELDTNQQASAYIEEAEPVRKMGTGDITVTSSSYSGPAEGIEYLVFIDGNGSQVGGAPDSFSWMEAGAFDYNETAQPISGTAYSLGYGITIDFNSTTAFEYGDAWRIKVTPSRNYVAVGTDPSYQVRLADAKANLIRAINRANSRGDTALRAYDPATDSQLSGMLPLTASSAEAIVLRLDGSYPVIGDVYATRGVTKVSTDLFGLIKASSGGTLKISDWDAWGLSNGLVDLRVVHIASDGTVSYSDKRTYPLVDPSRGFVELVGPFGSVYEPGRLPTIHFEDGFSNSLPSNASGQLINIVDGGDGYNWYDEDTKHISIVSSTGSGGNLMIQDISANAVTSVYAQSGELGSGYTSEDVIVPSPPAFFALNDSMALNAKLRDPYGEYQRVAFYVNGVEVNSTVQDRTGGFFGTSFPMNRAGDQFISARALYGDSRDMGPTSSIPFGQYTTDHQSYYAGKDYWGWKKSWVQQHYATGQEFLPTWFSQLKSYWIDVSEWDHQNMWDGAAPVRVGQVDVYESVTVSIDPSSNAFQREKLLHAQTTSVTATLEWEEGSTPNISSVHLYGNNVLLGEILEAQNNNSFNRISWDFEWLVNYKLFKHEEGQVDLKAIVVTEEGRQISSVSKRVEIRPLSLTDPLSTLAMIYMDLTGESPSDSELNNIEDVVSTDSMADLLESLVEYTIGGEKEYMADLIAAYHVLYGEIDLDADVFNEEYDEVKDSLMEDRTAGLQAYITQHITSRDYILKYELIPDNSSFFFGAQEGLYLGNRTAFVKRHYKNKYGTDASPIQYLQGAQKMWQFAGGNVAANNFAMNRLAAVDLIYNLATEPTEKVGLFNNISFPYLNGMKPLRPTYEEKALQYLLSKVSKQNKIPEEVEDAIDDAVQSRSFRRRFNLLWEDSETYDEFKNWKHEEWLGYFNDDAFPWIYLAELGWLYSSGTSHNNVWFYSPSLGWFWTNRETYRHHPNLTADNQRFIYRVSSGANGAQNGTWSLITVLNSESGAAQYHLYNYGYSSF